jgi:glucose/arabinose dehydrogenase
MIRFSSLLLLFALLVSFSKGIAQTKYQAPKAIIAPVIDGLGNDACWANTPWYTIDQLWLGVQPSPADFSGRFKVTWDANKLYILAEITDDVLSDYHSDPLSNYWEDDTWEIFIDENASGGNHEFSYNAFAYHISKSFDIVDMGPDQKAGLYNHHAQVARTNTGTNYIWEAAFDVYNDQYVFGATNNPKATLTAGKIMGFAMAYCDNDGGSTRQSFIGSEVVEGSNKNVAYINASVFGKMELVENVTPQFTHVRVATGLINPTAFTIAKDGRIFVCEQTGKVRVIENGQLLSEPALSITVNTSGPEGFTERGLLGITLDPDFENNNYFYIFYTAPETPVHSRVVRYTLNGNIANPSSAQVIIDLDPLSTAHNHNGGGLHFGLDGKLYVATGENATPSNAQNLDNTHGKILRLNPDGSIPTGNPFTTGSTQKKMIWAYGLRNPFTFDIQKSTGKIYVNDVGQTKFEEINDVTTPGQNFGWPSEEGNGSLYTNPVYTYANNSLSSGKECAITGGCFFEPAATNYPVKYKGKYFFMDYCSNWLRVLDPVTETIVEDFSNNLAQNPIGIAVHPDGNLYYLNRGAYDGSGVGNIFKITYSGNLEPEFQSHPESQSIAESQPVTFSSQATGAVPLNFQWYLNGVSINNATSATYTISAVSPTDAGKYTVKATNTYGSVTSNEATLTVTAFNSRPKATITSPANNTIFTGNQSFTFTGTGTDPEDGDLAPSQFKWKVDLYHATHVHDGIFSETGKTYSYTIPTQGHTETNIWYRVTLVVTDAGGLTDTAYIELQPKKVMMTFNTVPAGLAITLDGEPLPTPATIEGVTGILRALGVNDPQLLQNKAWAFASWTDGPPSKTYLITTPGTNKSYTANFTEVPITNESISPISDAFVQYTYWATSDATTTFGTTDQNDLVVKNYVEDPDRETYITFDLSNLGGNPLGLLSAKLILNGYMMDEEDPALVTINVHESKSTTWDENTITWNNKPGNNTEIFDTFSVTSFDTDQVFTADITSLIKSKLIAGASVTSIVLKASTDNKNRVFFNSKEKGNGPVIELQYENIVTNVITTEKTENLIIYPNPASDKLTIFLKNNSGNGVIEIMDQYSHVVLRQTINSDNKEHNIDLSKLNKGLYLVHFNNGREQLTQKLIIK